MTFFIITVVLLATLEIAVFMGVIKLVSELSGKPEESTAPDVPRAEGQDFWHNIISYDHKKKGGDKD